MLELEVTGLVRPAVSFEEILQPDGVTKVAGPFYSHAARFLTNEKPDKVYGEHDVLVLKTGKEGFQLVRARVMLAPVESDAPDKMAYVATYDMMSYVKY